MEEDKAEIFAQMMTEYAVVANRAATDPVIQKKMLAMKALLRKFCPDIDESFWARVLAGSTLSGIKFL